MNLNEGLVALEDWKIKAAELTVKKAELTEAELIFRLPPYKYTDLDEIIRKIEELTNVYQIYCGARSIKKLQASMLWENFNPEETLKEILKMENLCHRIVQLCSLQLIRMSLIFKKLSDLL